MSLVFLQDMDNFFALFAELSYLKPLVLSISVSSHCVNLSLLLSGFKLVCFAALVCLKA